MSSKSIDVMFTIIYFVIQKDLETQLIVRLVAPERIKTKILMSMLHVSSQYHQTNPIEFYILYMYN